MKDEYLLSKGWRRIGTRRTDAFTVVSYWDHPDHQPDDCRGAFTKSDAEDHQRHLNKGGKCDCVPSEGRKK